MSAITCGYSICLVFLKLFERVYSPLTAGLLQPYRADSKLQDHKRTQLNEMGSTPEEKSGKIQLFPWDIPQKRGKSWAADA
jgi:hypothetical protein